MAIGASGACQLFRDRHLAGGPLLPERKNSLLPQHIGRGRARTQSPTTRNCAVEIPTFGEFAGVSTAAVQWPSLALGEPPS